MDKNRREWRGRQDHARVEHCITGLCIVLFLFCIWSRDLYSCIVLVTSLCNETSIIWSQECIDMYLVTGLCKTYKMLCFTFSLSPLLQVINNTFSCLILSILFIKTIHSHSPCHQNNPFSLSLIKQSILILVD